MKVGVKHKGDWEKTAKYLKQAKKLSPMEILEKYGEIGVQALFDATPKDTGLTAASWYYKIDKTNDGYVISWNNSNVNNYVNIALILQYGHATRAGTYVCGVDYINPAMKEVFDKLSIEIWREVSD